MIAYKAFRKPVLASVILFVWIAVMSLSLSIRDFLVVQPPSVWVAVVVTLMVVADLIYLCAKRLVAPGGKRGPGPRSRRKDAMSTNRNVTPGLPVADLIYRVLGWGVILFYVGAMIAIIQSVISPETTLASVLLELGGLVLVVTLWKRYGRRFWGGLVWVMHPSESRTIPAQSSKTDDPTAGYMWRVRMKMSPNRKLKLGIILSLAGLALPLMYLPFGAQYVPRLGVVWTLLQNSSVFTVAVVCFFVGLALVLLAIAEGSEKGR